MRAIRRTLLCTAALCLVLLALCACEEPRVQTALKLGGIGPLTGPAAAYGTAVYNGAQLAVEEINAAGGVNGMVLSLEFADDEHDPEKAVNAYSTLFDHGMRALIGTVTSAPCVAVKTVAKADGLFMITPSGSAVHAIDGAENAFRLCFSDPSQGITAADYIHAHQLGTNVAVIYDSSDVYSSGIYESFSARAKEIGLSVCAVEAFTADSANDFSVQLITVQQSGADLLFLPIYYQEAALILDQAAKIGLSVPFFGCDGLDGLLRQLGDKTDLAEGVMLLTPFVPGLTDEKSVAFTTTYRVRFGETPNQFAADGYDSVYAIKLALEKAGVKESDADPRTLGRKLAKAMTQITLDGVTGRTVWSADGEPKKTPKAVVIRDGAYVLMDEKP